MNAHASPSPTAMFRPAHVTMLALAAALAGGCRSSSNSRSIIVDGVALQERHRDTLELHGWGTVPVHLESNLGAIVVRAVEGAGSIEVELIEKTPGDAHAWFEDGRIRVETSSGEPYAIGAITVRAPAAVPALSAHTGKGDVEVEGLRVVGALQLSSGAGDLRAGNTEAGGSAVLKTGMGNVVVEGLRSATLTADSGMGSVRVTDSVTGAAVLVSGMGNVCATDSVFEHLRVKSGLGDVNLSGTTYSSSELSTGTGVVRSER